MNNGAGTQYRVVCDDGNYWFYDTRDVALAAMQRLHADHMSSVTGGLDRWRELADEMGIPASDFGETCTLGYEMYEYDVDARGLAIDGHERLVASCPAVFLSWGTDGAVHSRPTSESTEGGR